MLYSWKHNLQTFKLENWSLRFVLLVLLQFYINFRIFNYSETVYIYLLIITNYYQCTVQQSKLYIYNLPKLRKLSFSVTNGLLMCSPLCYFVENIDIVKAGTLCLLNNRSKFVIRLQFSGFRHHYRNIYIYIYIYIQHNGYI